MEVERALLQLSGPSVTLRDLGRAQARLTTGVTELMLRKSGNGLVGRGDGGPLARVLVWDVQCQARRPRILLIQGPQDVPIFSPCSQAHLSKDLGSGADVFSLFVLFLS